MSAQENPRRRTAASAAAITPVRTSVKTSVPLDVETHAKLCGLAALKGEDRSTLAAEFIREGLRGVILFDKRKGSDHTNSSDRTTLGLSVDPDEENAA
jgi:hypothetical protein